MTKKCRFLLFVIGKVYLCRIYKQEILMVPPIQRPDDSIRWFAMRVTYRREIKVQDMLKEQGIECFVPMRYVMKVHRGKPKKMLVPVISSLVFVHTRQSVIQEFKKGVPYLQYMTDKAHEKIVVPDAQMTHFIAACGTYSESLMFFDPSEVNLAKGTRVRVIGGEFEGYEGVFVKVKGVRDRRLVIAIQGVIAVAMASIHPDLVVPIDVFSD